MVSINNTSKRHSHNTYDVNLPHADTLLADVPCEAMITQGISNTSHMNAIPPTMILFVTAIS